MEYVYKTQGTCSTNIELNVEDGVVKKLLSGEDVMVTFKVFPAL